MLGGAGLGAAVRSVAVSDQSEQQLLTTAFSDVALVRRPVDPHGGLLAWDGADRLLLDTLAASTGSSDGTLLVVDDSFGALTVSLRHHSPISWSDSAIAHLATRANLDAAGDSRDAHLVTDAASLHAHLGERRVDSVLWRIPRAVRVLRYQASVLQQVLGPGALVLAGGMDKHLPPETRMWLERLGEVRTLPGARKAHVFQVRFDATRPPLHAMDLPVIDVPEHAIALHSGHQSFSPEHLDPGSRLMATALAKLPPARAIADLCCGSGVLGLIAQRVQPTAAVTYFDESFSSVEAARGNVQRNLDAAVAARADFLWTDGMHAYDDPPFDVVVCNPPFHQNGAVTDAVAWQLFLDARANLVPGGELWVVGNRHLGYHAKLNRLFRNSRVVASNPKFVVVAAVAK